MITIVTSVVPGQDPVPLATFEMVDGKIEANYASPGFRREMETVGIYANGREYFPSDGQAFLDALPRHYSRSTTIHVETA